MWGVGVGGGVDCRGLRTEGVGVRDLRRLWCAGPDATCLLYAVGHGAYNACRESLGQGSLCR